MRKYAGKYVAIADEQVVSNGEDAGEVFENAKTRYPNEDILLWKVMEGDSFIF